MFCKNCGRELAGSPNFCSACGSGPLMGNRFCEVCGFQVDVSGRCPRCTTPPAQPEGDVVIEEKKQSSSGALTAGGILTIVSGALGILSGLINAVAGGTASYFRINESEVDIARGVYVVIGLALVVLGIVAVIGGIYALKKRKFALAVIGASCSIIAGCGCCCLGLPLGITALILIIISKGKFK